jgi:hypothetical protein
MMTLRRFHNFATSPTERRIAMGKNDFDYILERARRVVDICVRTNGEGYDELHEALEILVRDATQAMDTLPVASNDDGDDSRSASWPEEIKRLNPNSKR